MHAWQALRAAELLDVQPGQRILDIASGTGLATRAAVELAEGLTVVGVDVSRRMRKSRGGSLHLTDVGTS